MKKHLVFSLVSAVLLYGLVNEYVMRLLFFSYIYTERKKETQGKFYS